MPPPPPPLQPPLFPVNSAAAIGEHHSSYNPSFLIIAAIIAAAIVAASSIHLLLRVLSRSRSPPSIHNLPSPSSTSPSPPSPSDPDPTSVIHSLPLFSLSSLNKLTRSEKSASIDCAVCLSAFQTSDELRLLPSCRHVFHSKCIDTWLSSNLTCPLCRASIRHVSPSQSFKVEIGSVSLRSTSSAADAVRSRTYSIGSSFEYVVEGEIDAMVSRIPKREIHNVGPAGPGDDVAAGIGGRSSWLKEYIDRLASSASSSFSSLRRSGRRNDNGNNGNSLNDNYGESNWDLERNLHMHLEEEDGGFGTFYRWLVGV